MTAATMAAPTMEAASTMEPAATMEPRSAMTHCSTVETANRSVSYESRSTHPNSTTTVEAGMAIESAATVEARASIESAVEPWAGADENASGEIARSVVSVGRACVRVISIVAVGTRGRPSHVARSNSYADRHSLRASVRG